MYNLKTFPRVIPQDSASAQWLSDSTDRTKFVFDRGSASDPTGGAYSAPPKSLADLRGPTSKGEEREGEKGEGREKE